MVLNQKWTPEHKMAFFNISLIPALYLAQYPSAKHFMSQKIAIFLSRWITKLHLINHHYKSQILDTRQPLPYLTRLPLTRL